MTIRPGRNLIWSIFAIAALSPIVFLWQAFAGVLGGALLVLFLASVYDFLRVRTALGGVAIGREMPLIVGRDSPFDVGLSLTSSTAAPLRGSARDEVPAWAVDGGAMPTPHSHSSPGGDQAQAERRTAPSFHRFSVQSAASTQINQSYRLPRRGRHTFGPVWVRIEGPWRLVDAQRAIECPGVVRVLPETFASRDELIKDIGAQALLLDKIAFARQHGAGTEFESLYPYRLGDDPRRIDWRASARYRFPIVRRYQVERHRDVMILIDCGRLMGAETDRGSKLDCAVDAGLNLARVALQSGDRCGMGLFDDQVRGYLPPVAGVASIRALSECVFDVQTEWRESDFTQMFAQLQLRQAKRSLVVVISDIGDVETSRQLRAALRQLGRRHLVLFAALRTPLLGRIVAEPMHSLLDGARKAVTFRLLRERQQALHALKRSGVHIVDVQPHQLTLPLINQFIELRQKNLL